MSSTKLLEQPLERVRACEGQGPSPIRIVFPFRRAIRTVGGRPRGFCGNPTPLVRAEPARCLPVTPGASLAPTALAARLHAAPHGANRSRSSTSRRTDRSTRSASFGGRSQGHESDGGAGGAQRPRAQSPEQDVRRGGRQHAEVIGPGIARTSSGPRPAVVPFRGPILHVAPLTGNRADRGRDLAQRDDHAPWMAPPGSRTTVACIATRPRCIHLRAAQRVWPSTYSVRPLSEARIPNG